MIHTYATSKVSGIETIVFRGVGYDLTVNAAIFVGATTVGVKGSTVVWA